MVLFTHLRESQRHPFGTQVVVQQKTGQLEEEEDPTEPPGESTMGK